MRYISNTDNDRKEMLEAIGVRSFEELIEKIPASLQNFQLDIPAGLSEPELMHDLGATGRMNKHAADHASYLGGGVYDHYVPTVVSHLAHRGEFITSYTPYQGEASQGTLQAVYEYQTMICELTGMEFSNASMYDGASSLAEAALLAIRATGKRRIVLPATLHPEYKAVVRTYLSCLDAEIVEAPAVDWALDGKKLAALVTSETAAVVLQQPNFFGVIEDARAVSDAAKKAGALFIACVNPVSLGLLEPPGEYGADIAVGEGQPLGNPVSFGGPHFGFFTVNEELLRKIPGRIAGMTVDKAGRRSFVLTLQAREQHIRREKATSNICTNHSLCALKSAIYLSLLGPEGLRRLALLNLQNAHETHDRLLAVKGVRALTTRPFFNEFAIEIDKDPVKLKESLLKNRVLGPLALRRFFPEMKNAYLVAVTENRTKDHLERLVEAVERA